MKINTAHNIGERVKVVPLDIKGKITGIFVDKAGYEYQVSYFYNGEMKRAYFEGDDIEVLPQEDNGKCGFFSNIK